MKTVASLSQFCSDLLIKKSLWVFFTLILFVSYSYYGLNSYANFIDYERLFYLLFWVFILVATLFIGYLSLSDLKQDMTALQNKLSKKNEKRPPILDALIQHLGLTNNKFLNLFKYQAYKSPWYLLLSADKHQLSDHNLLANGQIKKAATDKMGESTSPEIQWLETSTGFFLHQKLDGQFSLANFQKLVSRLRPWRSVDSIFVSLRLQDILLNPKVFEDFWQLMNEKLAHCAKGWGRQGSVHLLVVMDPDLPGHQEYRQASIALNHGVLGTRISHAHPAKKMALRESLEKLWHWLEANKLNYMSQLQEVSPKGHCLAFIHNLQTALIMLTNTLHPVLADVQTELSGLYFIGEAHDISETSGNISKNPNADFHHLVQQFQAKPDNSSRFKSLITRYFNLGRIFVGVSYFITFLVLIGLILSFSNNLTLVQTYNRVLEENAINETKASKLEIFDFYSQIKHLSHNRSLTHRFGLFQGLNYLKELKALLCDEAIEDAKRASYYIRDELSHLNQSWSSATGDYQNQNLKRYYQNLKTYLLLHKSKALARSKISLPIDEQCKDKLHAKGSSDALLSNWLRWGAMLGSKKVDFPKLDEKLIKVAQENLQSASGRDALIYEDFLSKVTVTKQYGLDEILNEKSQDLLHSGVKLDTFYTLDHWHNCVSQEILNYISHSSPDWVLSSLEQSQVQFKRGSESLMSQRKKLKSLLEKHYWRAYRQHWLEFISSIEVNLPNDTSELATTLANIIKKNYLERLLQFVLKNQAISETKINHYLGHSIQSKRKYSLRTYHQILGKFQQAVRRVSSQPQFGQQSQISSFLSKLYQSEAQVPVNELLLAIHDLSDSWPKEPCFESLKQLLERPLQTIRTVMERQVLAELSPVWQSQVLKPYQSTMLGKFPLQNSETEVKLDDFVSFFQPKSGTLWQFVDKELAHFLEFRNGKWSPKIWLRFESQIPKDFIEKLNRAQGISQVFFKTADRQVHFDFELTPIPAAAYREQSFQLNSSRFTYRNEPQEWHRFTWPNQGSATERCRLTVVSVPLRKNLEYQAHGPWSLFKVLAKASLQGAEQSEHYRLTWQLEPKSRPIKFDLKTNRDITVLWDLFAKGFDLPHSIE